MEDTFNPSRNSVVTSSRDGNIENSNASEIFIVISKITMDKEILTMIRTSSRNVGSGKIRKSTITTTNSEMMLLKSRLMAVLLKCSPASLTGYSVPFIRYRYTRTSATAPYSSGGISRFNSAEA